MIIDSRIQIEDGPIVDFFKEWGFIYLSGDRRFAAPEKKRDTSSYPEEPGEHTDPRTVDDAFDYSVKFLIETPNKDLVNANSKIHAWNEAVRERTAGSGIKRCKTVTFYDIYKRCKIVGIPEVIAEVDEDDYYRRQDGLTMDCVEVLLTIHVSNPNLCDFDVKTSDVTLNLTTNGVQIQASTSRALEGGEVLRLLSCGKGRSRLRFAPKDHGKSKNRWHVNQSPNARCASFAISPDGTVEFDHERRRTNEISLIGRIKSRLRSGDLLYSVWKSNDSKMWFPFEIGHGGKICYGFAIYRGRKRVSNVAYFRLNFKVATVDVTDVEDGIVRWVTI